MKLDMHSFDGLVFGHTDCLGAHTGFSIAGRRAAGAQASGRAYWRRADEAGGRAGKRAGGQAGGQRGRAGGCA